MLDLSDTLLQRVQNAWARMVLVRGKYEDVTPMFTELYWLPIKSPLQYRVLLLTYKGLHGLEPKYPLWLD